METLDHLDNSPDPHNVSPRNTGLRYGVILGLAGVVMQLVMYMLGIGEDGEASNLGVVMGILSFAVTIGIMVYGVRFHRDKELGGFMGFSRGMTVMFWIGIANGVITTIWTLVYNNFINTASMELFQEELEKIKAQVADDEVPEITLSVMEWTHSALTNPLALFIFSLISTLIIGLFISLFVKRDRYHA